MLKYFYLPSSICSLFIPVNNFVKFIYMKIINIKFNYNSNNSSINEMNKYFHFHFVYF